MAYARGSSLDRPRARAVLFSMLLPVTLLLLSGTGKVQAQLMENLSVTSSLGVAFPLGDPDEASLDAALTYVTTGACPVAAARLSSVDTAPSGDAEPLSNVLSRRYAGAY